MTKGSKITEGKQQWRPMPLELLEPLAQVFVAGVGHYGLFNCMGEFDEPDATFWDALLRHLVACQRDPLARDGQDGCYHLAKVAFNALMRLHHCRRQADRTVKDSLSVADIIQPFPVDGDDDPATINLDEWRPVREDEVHLVVDKTTRSLPEESLGSVCRRHGR